MTNEEQIKERYDTYRKCFGTDDGKWVLDDLEQQFLFTTNEQTRNAKRVSSHRARSASKKQHADGLAQC